MSSYHSMNRMSTYSARKSMTPSMTSHDSCSRRISVAPSGRKSMVSRRNGLDDDYGRQSFAQKNFALQTCTETGVGDCPACLGAKSNCHRDTCELCCEKNTCGPNFKNCPYAPEAEVQTDPICLFSNLPCQCSDPCDLSPCMIAERCGFTGVDCRCIERACNTSKHCIIVDDEELCPATDVECRCVDKGCGTYSTCIVYEEESDDPDNDYYSQQQDDFYDEFTATDYCPNEPPGLYTAEDIIARCHALCQTDNTQNQPEYFEVIDETGRSYSIVDTPQNRATMSAYGGGSVFVAQPNPMGGGSIFVPQPSQVGGSMYIPQPGGGSIFVPQGQQTVGGSIFMPQGQQNFGGSIFMPQGNQGVGGSIFMQQGTQCGSIFAPSGRKKFCKNPPYNQQVVPGYDNISVHSYESSKHSAFGTVEPEPSCDPVLPEVTEEGSYTNFQVDIEEIPVAGGQSVNKISITAVPQQNKQSIVNPSVASKGTSSTCNGSTRGKSMSVPAKKSQSTMSNCSEKNKMSMQQAPMGPYALGPSVSKSSHKSILTGKTSQKSLVADSQKPKSQVHFDIDIVGPHNDRTIVLRRSMQVQTRPSQSGSKPQVIRKSVRSSTPFL